MFRFDKKTAIVTGGGSGIGRGIATMFARQGAHVEILDVNESAAQDAVADIQSAGNSAALRLVDITSQSELSQTVDAILSDRGRIDILVNNAGVAHVGNVTTTSESDFDRVMNVNVKGVYNGCHLIIPRMLAGGGGVILNIASTVAFFGLAERFAYSTSKGAVVALTYSVARDFVRQNIRCNAILPGRIHTPFVDGFVAQNYPGQEAEMMQKLSDFQPIGRMGTPEEIASAAVYLCSDEASFVTGSVHAIDGGTITLR